MRRVGATRSARGCLSEDADGADEPQKDAPGESRLSVDADAAAGRFRYLRSDADAEEPQKDVLEASPG
jgi:hypothetical protein